MENSDMMLLYELRKKLREYTEQMNELLVKYPNQSIPEHDRDRIEKLGYSIDIIKKAIDNYYKL